MDQQALMAGLVFLPRAMFVQNTQWPITAEGIEKKKKKSVCSLIYRHKKLE